MGTRDSSSVPGLVRAFVSFALRRGRMLWLAALLLAIPATWRTAQLYLHLRSELEELLPSSSPSVLAIDELRSRMAGLQHLGVVVDTGTAENLPAGERFLDDLAARLRSRPNHLIRAVRVGNDQERRYLEGHAPLYVDLSDLVKIRQRIEARRDYEVEKSMGQLLDDSEEPPSLDFSDIEQKYRSVLREGEQRQGGRFSSPELHCTVMVIDFAEFSTGQGQGRELLDQVKSDVRSLGGLDHYAPGMRLGYSGDIAIAVEETQALMSDLSFSSVVVLVLVVAVILVYFRWWRSIFVLVPPLLLATVYAFGLSSLPPFRVTELNSNTAFLGSIIVGNGINFGIILLARYTEERRRGTSIEEAMTLAVWGARPGTLSAALAAGVAYASLALTEFRGFRQFGYIGGLGMLLSWAVTFLLVPSLAARLDARGSAAKTSAASTGSWMAPVAKLIKARPGSIVLAGLLLTAGATWELRGVGSQSLEYDFSKLRRADTWVSGEGYWGRKMDAVLGSYLTPTVLLTDSPAAAARLRKALDLDLAKPPLNAMTSSLHDASDVIPTQQVEKIAEAEKIRKLMTPRMRQLVPKAKHDLVERMLKSDRLARVGPDGVPATFLVGLRERDGSMGKTVVVFPKPSRALWEGPPLAQFAAALRGAAREAKLPGEREARVAGSLVLSADILEAVRKDGLKASLSALVGVILVVLVLFRFSRTTVLVLGSLLVGVAWLGAASVLFHVKVNFANFIAFPITFGIGVDYAVNVMSRWVGDGSKDVVGAVRSTGGAVALCSLTTIIGYSSLLLAENQALFLFGLLAVLGELTCLVSALVLLPAALLTLQRQSGGVDTVAVV